VDICLGRNCLKGGLKTHPLVAAMLREPSHAEFFPSAVSGLGRSARVMIESVPVSYVS